MRLLLFIHKHYIDRDSICLLCMNLFFSLRTTDCLWGTRQATLPESPESSRWKDRIQITVDWQSRSLDGMHINGHDFNGTSQACYLSCAQQSCSDRIGHQVIGAPVECYWPTRTRQGAKALFYWWVSLAKSQCPQRISVILWGNACQTKNRYT